MSSWGLAIHEILRIDLADEILFEYVVHVLLLMDGENAPIRLNTATDSAKDDLATRMVGNPLSDVVDAVPSEDPVSVGFAVMLMDLGQSDEPGLSSMRWLLRECCLRIAGQPAGGNHRRDQAYGHTR